MPEIAQEKSLQIEAHEIKKGALVLRAINHPLRRQLLQLLHEKRRSIVTDLYVKLRIEQSVASQHLAILRRAGFVQTEREGKFIYYSVNYARLREVEKLADELLKIGH